MMEKYSNLTDEEMSKMVTYFDKVINDLTLSRRI